MNQENEITPIENTQIDASKALSLTIDGGAFAPAKKTVRKDGRKKLVADLEIATTAMIEAKKKVTEDNTEENQQLTLTAVEVWESLDKKIKDLESQAGTIKGQAKEFVEKVTSGKTTSTDEIPRVSTMFPKHMRGTEPDARKARREWRKANGVTYGGTSEEKRTKALLREELKKQLL